MRAKQTYADTNYRSCQSRAMCIAYASPRGTARGEGLGTASGRPTGDGDGEGSASCVGASGAGAAACCCCCCVASGSRRRLLATEAFAEGDSRNRSMSLGSAPVAFSNLAAFDAPHCASMFALR